MSWTKNGEARDKPASSAIRIGLRGPITIPFSAPSTLINACADGGGASLCARSLLIHVSVQLGLIYGIGKKFRILRLPGRFQSFYRVSPPDKISTAYKPPPNCCGRLSVGCGCSTINSPRTRRAGHFAAMARSLTNTPPPTTRRMAASRSSAVSRFIT